MKALELNCSAAKRIDSIVDRKIISSFDAYNENQHTSLIIENLKDTLGNINIKSKFQNEEIFYSLNFNRAKDAQSRYGDICILINLLNSKEEHIYGYAFIEAKKLRKCRKVFSGNELDQLKRYCNSDFVIKYVVYSDQTGGKSDCFDTELHTKVFDPYEIVKNTESIDLDLFSKKRKSFGEQLVFRYLQGLDLNVPTSSPEGGPLYDKIYSDVARFVVDSSIEYMVAINNILKYEELINLFKSFDFKLDKKSYEKIDGMKNRTFINSFSGKTISNLF